MEYNTQKYIHLHKKLMQINQKQKHCKTFIKSHKHCQNFNKQQKLKKIRRIINERQK